MKDGYYWIKPDHEAWEVVEVSGGCEMYRTGSDVSVIRGEDGIWREFGSEFSFVAAVDRIEPPNT